MWWESVVIAGLTLCAAAFLVRTFWKTVSGEGGCGCGKKACGALKTLDSNPAISKSEARAKPISPEPVAVSAEASDAT